MKPSLGRTNDCAFSEEDSVESKRRRQTPAHGSAGGGNPNSGSRSVTSEGSASKQSAKNKKRFVWPDDLHRDFVAAIFEVGLRSATPKTILEMMTNTRELTADHIKSHLQKYRLHRERARKEFLGNFGRPDNNLSRDTSAVGEGAMDSDPSPSLLPRSGGLGGGMSMWASSSSSAVPGAAEGGGGGGAGGDGADEEGDAFDGAQETLIRECLSMQAGFQNVLKQALLSQQQLQGQLHAHLRGLGLEGSVDEKVGDGAPRPSGLQQSDATAGAASMHGSMGPGRGGGVKSASTNWGKVNHRHPAAPSTQNQPPPPPPPSQHHPTSNGQHHPITVTPSMQRRSADQRMQVEMKEHMDMHRQLVQRKNALVSQYDGGSLMATATHVGGNVGGGSSSHHHQRGQASSSSQSVQQPAAHQHHHQHHHDEQPQEQQQQLQHPQQHPPSRGERATAPHMGGGSSSGAAAGDAQGAVADNGAQDIMDFTQFRWNDDDDYLFNFLMDPS